MYPIAQKRSSRKRWRCIKIRPGPCLAEVARDSQRCGKPLITARRAAVIRGSAVLELNRRGHAEPVYLSAATQSQPGREGSHRTPIRGLPRRQEGKIG